MTNIQKYNQLIELFATFSATKEQLKSDEITVKALRELKEQKAEVSKSINQIANDLYNQFIQFAKNRRDLFDYNMAQHHFYKNAFSGCEPKLKKCGSVVTSYDSFDGCTWDKGGHIVIPKLFIYDPEAFEQQRKVIMLENKVKYLNAEIAKSEDILAKQKRELLDSETQLFAELEKQQATLKQ